VQIIVVDNASMDNSLEYIASRYPNIEVLRNRENYGFCLGNNLGYQLAKGAYIIFANNDAIFAHDCVEKLVNAAQTSRKIGAVSPKLVRPLTEENNSGRQIDSAGLTMRKDFT
jgi:GT2 family glycosyltransferase